LASPARFERSILLGDRRGDYGEQPVAQKALNDSLISTNRLGHLENPAHQKVGFFLAKPVPRSAHTMPYGEKHSRVIGLLGLPTGPRSGENQTSARSRNNSHKLACCRQREDNGMEFIAVESELIFRKELEV
jgi:hypothetical protein